MNILDIYDNYIHNRYNDLLLSNKEIDNYDLAKIFEYYSCIQLSKKYNQVFYEYNDIDPTFKEDNKMSRTDTGIDCSNLIDTIVQCKPLTTVKNKDVKSYSIWLTHNINNYKKKEGLMKSDKVYKLWEEFINDDKYKEYFLSNEDSWINTLKLIKQYIDDNEKRPSSHDEDKKIQFYGRWLVNQQQNYSKNLTIIKNKNLKILWGSFINNPKYKQYFLSNEDVWVNTLDKVKEYMDNFEKRPSSKNNNKEISFLGSWVINQYSNKNRIMKNIEIIKKWELFINDPKYKEYLLSSEDSWKYTLENI